MAKENVTIISALQQIAHSFSGTLGIAATAGDGCDDKHAVHWNDSESFPPASVIKVPLLYSALRLVQQGRLSLDQRLVLTEDDIVLGSGVLRDMQVGLAPTVHDLLMLMTIVSDNTATNMVIDLVGGPDRVNEDMAALGLNSTYLSGKLMLPPEKRSDAQKAGAVSRTSAADMVRLIGSLLSGNELGEPMQRVAQTIMLRQHYTDSLTRLLPWDQTEPYAPWEIGAKSGSVVGVRNQVGWMHYKQRTFCFAIMSKQCRDTRFFSENEANNTIAATFRALFNHFMQ